MELSEETTASSDTSNPQNVSKGLASDIKITFKNKTIIAPLQKPEADSQSKDKSQRDEEECTSSNNDVQPKLRSWYRTKAGKRNKSPNSRSKNNRNKMSGLEWLSVKPANLPPLPYCYDMYNSSYPKGIPKSFLGLGRLQPGPLPISIAPVTAPDSGSCSTDTAAVSPEEITPLPTPEPDSSKQMMKPNIRKDHLELPSWIKTINDDSDEDSSFRAKSASSNARVTSDSASQDESLKRMNVFDIEGPLVQPPKRSKMIINLLCNKTSEEKAKTEVDLYVPVTKRPEVVESKDEVIMKCLRLWPYKQEIAARRIVSAYDRIHNSIEFEKLIDESERLTTFIQVYVTKIPVHYTAETVLDLILDHLKEKNFVPFFIELTAKGLKFLVANHRNAIISLYKSGLRIRSGGHDLMLEVAGVVIKFLEKTFVAKLLKKQLLLVFDGEKKLNLKAFCQDKCIKHFIYFPLNRITNQITLRSMDVIQWKYLVELDLSDNKLESIEGFELAQRAPRLRHLNLSNNLIEKVSILLSCRGLALKTLVLEGNPLCNDYYTDPTRYIKVVKLIFPTLKELDGVEILGHGEMPHSVQNHCPTPATAIVEKYLETFYPLLDASPEDRDRMVEMYDEDCLFTVTHNKYCNRYSYLRALFAHSRGLDAGNYDVVRGAAAVAQLVEKWPPLAHDRTTFVVDVLHHSDTSTVVSVSGAVKTIAKKLSEDEQLLAFKRTVVLASDDAVEYKICNEMLYWDNPSKSLEAKAFSITSVNPLTQSSTKFESCPDDDLKEKLVVVFTSITGLIAEQSLRYLEKRQWDIRAALEEFVKDSQDLLRSSKVYLM